MGVACERLARVGSSGQAAWYVRAISSRGRSDPRVRGRVYAAHKHPDVQRWLARHKRLHRHFTPDLLVVAESGRVLVA
jgi:hypothetical protein